ncbi:MAG: alpha/beta hydrolase [Cyclobacteriaceae bacterium]|nr:alpha/beta hydrolase [Cyclobacteriaceae bacterium]UYN88269.1 MAG: alpha/beta hydrolase [Cyclobacteriaceae bacterium]
MRTITKKIYLVAGLITCIIALCLLQSEATASPSFKVEKVGKGKQHIILIPGLTCPGDVWNETIARYKSTYTLHVISLPGFAGTPAIETAEYLKTMRDELIGYIKDNKLKKPILVGHSLGGFLSLWISAVEPDLVGPNFIVDALPFLPAIQNPAATVETIKPMAASMRDMMKNATPEQIKQSQQYYLSTMASSPDKLELIGRWGLESHAPTVAQAMYELQTIDLRNDVAAINVPVTVLGAWIAYKDYGVTHESALKNFSDQYQHVKNVTIQLTDTAKHFIMYDDPKWFFEQMDKFLSTNKNRYYQ